MGDIEEILANSKSIAVLGAKIHITEDAYKIPLYMYQAGYRILPVNPNYTSEEIFGERIVSSLNDIKIPVDLVNIFRRPDTLVAHAREILEMIPVPKYVWFQLGIYNDDAAKLLNDNGIKVVQNRCIMVEHVRLFNAK
jgi:uncharacterized protein